ncbi:MAG: cytochrome c-type biogenesis protein [Acidimicrobiales bacterium]
MTRRRRLLTLSWGLLAVVVVVTLAVSVVGSEPPTPAQRVRIISSQFACPQCDGQSVANSDAAIANQIEIVIAERVEAGQSDDQILSFLVNAYGRQYLLNPSASGAASLVWVLPVVAVVVAFGALGYAFWRWRPSDAPEVSDADRALVEQAMRRNAAGSSDAERGER